MQIFGHLAIGVAQESQKPIKPLSRFEPESTASPRNMESPQGGLYWPSSLARWNKHSGRCTHMEFLLRRSGRGSAEPVLPTSLFQQSPRSGAV
jgi:hypothetical protein